MLVMQRHRMCHAHDSHESADGQIFCQLNSCIHHKSVSVATTQATLKSRLVRAALSSSLPFPWWLLSVRALLFWLEWTLIWRTGEAEWAFRICTNRNQIAIPTPPHPHPLPPALKTTHKHTHIAGSVRTTAGSRAANLCFRNTADVIQSRSFSLTYPTPLLPNPHPHIQHTHAKKKKETPQSPSYAKTLFVYRKCFFWRVPYLPGTQTLHSRDDFIILFKYLRQAFVFLPSNLLLLWVRVLGFYHSNVNSVFPPNPFLLRRGPSLWCLKVAISPKRLWLPG